MRHGSYYSRPTHLTNGCRPDPSAACRLQVLHMAQGQDCTGCLLTRNSALVHSRKFQQKRWLATRISEPRSTTLCQSTVVEREFAQSNAMISEAELTEARKAAAEPSLVKLRDDLARFTAA